MHYFFGFTYTPFQLVAVFVSLLLLYFLFFRFYSMQLNQKESRVSGTEIGKQLSNVCVCWSRICLKMWNQKWDFFFFFFASFNRYIFTLFSFPIFHIAMCNKIKCMRIKAWIFSCSQRHNRNCKRENQWMNREKENKSRIRETGEMHAKECIRSATEELAITKMKERATAAKANQQIMKIDCEDKISG